MQTSCSASWQSTMKYSKCVIKTALKLSLRREESSEHLRFAASMGIHQGQLEGQFAMVG